MRSMLLMLLRAAHAAKAAHFNIWGLGGSRHHPAYTAHVVHADFPFQVAYASDSSHSGLMLLVRLMLVMRLMIQ